MSRKAMWLVWALSIAACVGCGPVDDEDDSETQPSKPVKTDCTDTPDMCRYQGAMMPRARRAIVATVAVLAMALAACGPTADDEGENGPTETGGDDCAEFCSGESPDPAMCKACHQGPRGT